MLKEFDSISNENYLLKNLLCRIYGNAHVLILSFETVQSVIWQSAHVPW